MSFQPGDEYIPNPKLKEQTPDMVRFLKQNRIGSIHIVPNVDILGRSWEMACVLGVLGVSGVYSGTADFVNGNITFGPVPGVSIKRDIAKNMKTHVDVPFAYSYVQ